MGLLILGSSYNLPAHWEGGARARFLSVATKKFASPSEGAAEGGSGGNSAAPEHKIEAKPAALLVESRSQKKSFLFLLEEKILRAQKHKSRENFFAGWRAVASGGG
ncbi:MAG: hypothetical protein HY426_04770, partial [Candidatus Levybacteria bacterium]|nr:hypothetical protein [Candidatus Levybacteria bacterium]